MEGSRFSSGLFVFFLSLLGSILILWLVLKTEAYLVIGVLVYVLSWYIGSTINARKAKSWHVSLSLTRQARS